MVKIFSAFLLANLFLFSFIAGAYHTMSDAAFTHFLSEAGPLEILSALFFAIASLLAAYAFSLSRTKLHFAFAYLMAMACMRELDLHKQWTTDSILKSRFYSSDNTPIIEKIIGAVVILLLVIAVFILMKNTLKWIRALMDKNVVAWAVFISLGSMVTGKFLDSSQRLLPFIADFKTENSVVFLTAEEGLEFISAAFFIVTAALLIKKIKQSRQTD